VKHFVARRCITPVRGTLLSAYTRSARPFVGPFLLPHLCCVIIKQLQSGADWPLNKNSSKGPQHSFDKIGEPSKTPGDFLKPSNEKSKVLLLLAPPSLAGLHHVAACSPGAQQWHNVTCFVDRLCGLVVKSSCLQTQRCRVRFQELQDFLRSSGSGTGSARSHEDK
jgi:hypothetical protein